MTAEELALQEAYVLLRRRAMSPKTPKVQRDALNIVLERVAEVSPYVSQPFSEVPAR